MSQSSEVTYSWADAGKDLLVGAALSLPTALTAGAAVPMMEAVKASAGKKVLQRGVTVGYAVMKTVKKELHHLGQSIGIEALGNLGSWFMEKQGGIIIAKFDG